MDWRKPTVISRVKELKTAEAIRNDPSLFPVLQNVLPLTGQLGKYKETKKTLGKGSFGRVNLEVYNQGEVATKYFLDPTESLCENLTEVFTLKYLQGLPNVAQIAGIRTENSSGAPLEFPAVILGKGIGDLNDNLQKSWEEIYMTCIQVLRGYYTLHSMGIVHRDTKPANMLVTSSEEVWISDFGNARYIDTWLPKPDDDYPGTYSFASPELLMRNIDRKKKYGPPVDPIKSDIWSVGMSLYRFVTETSIQYGGTVLECIKNLFKHMGTPVESDGEVFELYTTLPQKESLEATVPRGSNKVQGWVERFARFKSDENKEQVAQIAKVINAMLEYDPNKRPTIADVLQMPGMPGLPPPLERPSILPQYIQFPSFPINDITEKDFEKALENIVTYQRTSLGGSVGKAFLEMDRASGYFIAFLKEYLTDPFCSKENLKTIGVSALILAKCLITTDSTPRYLKKSEMEELNLDKTAISNCLRMFMKSNIQIYGRTFFDDLLATAESMTRDDYVKYAYINLGCIQKQILTAYADRLDVLREKIVQFVKSYEHTNNNDSNPPTIIPKFITYLQEGGRTKRYKKSRRVKRRKHNTTLKVRNG